MNDSATITVDLLQSIGDAVQPHVRNCLRICLASVPDGMNSGDVGSNIRTELIKTLPGLLVPHGVITSRERSTRSPKNTTWLPIPTDVMLLESTVSCARMIQPGLYQLSAHESSYLGRSGLSGLLFGSQVLEMFDAQHLLWAVEWNYLWDKQHKRKEGMKAVVRLLWGSIDVDQRLFIAAIEHDVVFVDTRLESTVSGVNADAVGPEPTLAPRRDL